MGPKKVSAESRPAWVVLICGLPGSGKSTLRQRLVEQGWSYVCQDEMQTADACEKEMVKALKSGRSCVVDRCNVTPSERRLWLQHANRAVEKGLVKGVTLRFEVVWMATSPEVCKERARGRTAHETLSPERADEVIDSFCRGLRPPERSGQEPYDAVHVVATEEDADLVARRFASPSCVDQRVQLAPPSKALAAAAAAAAAGEEAGGEEQEAVAGAGATASAANAAKGVSAPEVFILRHGERADRARGRDDGWADDPPLTKEGRQMAKRAGCALCTLASLPWAPAVYTSPFYRCLQTANEVAAELGLPVRIEPGLSELCCSRIFDQQPRLRNPDESIASALQRVEADLSAPPHQAAPPQWPEAVRQANARVLQTAQGLVARHPGQAVCIVCHSHSLVELTRHLPKAGGGAVGSQSGYCALTHLAPDGSLLRSLDHSYLEASPAYAGSRPSAEGAAPSAEAVVGRWAEGWRWQGPEGESARDPVDDMLDEGLEDVLERYPVFRQLFYRGAPDRQEAWRSGWAKRSPELRQKLQQAHASGVFKPPATSQTSAAD